MYTALAPVTLKSGERVEFGVVAAPDADWSARLQKLLLHKDDIWQWQNTELLTTPVGIEPYFYILHRGGKPFANIMTAEYRGVGLFGHVWTDEADRGQGASSSIMAQQMEHFRSRGGKALYLGTGFDGVPYRMYAKLGFVGIEDGSGSMTWTPGPKAHFEADYFAKGPATVSPLDWTHWPTSSPLFASALPGVVRSSNLRLLGRTLTEGPFLPVIRDERKRRADGAAPRAIALAKDDNGAVVGFAMLEVHPAWPDAKQLDLWCHPDFWDRAPELIAPLGLATAGRTIAYGDAETPLRNRALKAAGFHAIGTLPKFVAADVMKKRLVDVIVYDHG
ncbi:MAG: GNAT family N-acetyltransferase [Planctomycetes bacterium]|nr:GNAT family N-acetyltransferase [Planctomycetota bacterium]